MIILTQFNKNNIIQFNMNYYYRNETQLLRYLKLLGNISIKKFK